MVMIRSLAQEKRQQVELWLMALGVPVNENSGVSDGESPEEGGVDNLSLDGLDSIVNEDFETRLKRAKKGRRNDTTVFSR